MTPGDPHSKSSKSLSRKHSDLISGRLSKKCVIKSVHKVNVDDARQTTTDGHWTTTKAHLEHVLPK